ncbi:ATPase [Pararhodobacter oceanensis]|uniref:ATPase n=1 Tax=Pararhodobacter oceanensis TaxID=2172121 RepID=A0A2T8HUF0_9RHOB|nr:ATPase [Pararhodobacter oceanensis]PVH29033.1 ATPase [Pararhodobacter oceanensis]
MNDQTPGASAITPPPMPASLADTGLPMTLMRDNLLKTMFRMSLNHASELARILCLSFSQVQQLIDDARGEHLIEAMGTMHATAMSSEMGFQLTDAGRNRAQQALAISEYYGAMPVPLDAYGDQVRRQSIRKVRITREQLLAAMGDLILPEGLLGDLGPAVTSGRSILMYGPPGNGKSSISNGIRDAMGDNIYVPRAVLHAGQIISVYDPIVHRLVEPPKQSGNALRVTGLRYDPRYVLCERPTVITGGELKLDMLELKYNAVSRTYQAPLQFKATGGVFIVDDLGRQEEPPQALINRWIVPLEMNYDILSLNSGEKFIVPFDTLVIFSTNFHPNDIFDQAALRRIFFKIKIDGPNQADFLKIFALVARKRRIPLNEEALIHLLQTKYPTIDNVYSNYQPVFLIDQMIAICNFEGRPHHMSPDLIDRAWKNMFVRDEDILR